MPQDKIELDKDLDAPYYDVDSVNLTDEDIKRIDSALREAVKTLDLGNSLQSHSYQQSPYEKRVDFAAVKKVLDEDAVKTDLALRAPIRKVLDDLIELMKRQDKFGGITDSFVMGITLTTGPETQRMLGDYLLGVWKKGRELAARELPVSLRLRLKIRDFEFCPTGEGGGIDPTCSPTGGEVGKKDILDIVEKTSDRLSQMAAFKVLHGIGKASQGTTVGRKRAWNKVRRELSGKGITGLRQIEVMEDIRKRIREKIASEKNLSHLTKQFAGLEPVQAINFFQNLRPWLIKGIIDDELKKSARLELTEHLKGGRTLTETIGNLRSTWEPWVGDPTKVIPSGISGTAEDILQAYRLENIVRTEAITALSQGRAEIGDEAGDFVVGYQLSPILDERTSEVCNRIGDLEEQGRPVQFRKDDPRAEKLTPALHYQCRTIPVFVTTDDLPVRWSTEAELDSVLRLVPEGFK